MCQDPKKIRDPGSGTLTDPISCVCILSRDPVDPGPCPHSFCGILWVSELFRKIAAGSWGSWILLRQNSFVPCESGIESLACFKALYNTSAFTSPQSDQRPRRTLRSLTSLPVVHLSRVARRTPPPGAAG